MKLCIWAWNGEKHNVYYEAKSIDGIKPEHKAKVALLDAADMDGSVLSIKGVGVKTFRVINGRYNTPELWYDLDVPVEG